MNGRHWKFFVIICAQYLIDLAPSLRSNIDYIFSCKETSAKNKKNLYENFYSSFPNFNSFNHAFDALTANYQVIVQDNTSANAGSVEQCVFWYKASTGNKQFLLGNRNLWKMAYGSAQDDNNKSAPRLDLIPALNKKSGGKPVAEKFDSPIKKKKKNGGSLTIIERKDVNGGDLKPTPENTVLKPLPPAVEQPKRQQPIARPTVQFDDATKHGAAAPKNKTTSKPKPAVPTINMNNRYEPAYMDDFQSIFDGGKSLASTNNSMAAVDILFRK